MYNIQNTSGKNVALMLERGGFVLKPSQYLDLDKHCVRKWIHANKDIQRLILTHAIRLVHDSEVELKKAPIKHIARPNVEPSRVVSNKPVEIVDLSAHPDVEVDEMGRVVRSEGLEKTLPQELKKVFEEGTKELVESVTQAALVTVQQAASVAATQAATTAAKEALATVAHAMNPDYTVPVREPDAEENEKISLISIPAAKPEAFIKNRMKKLEKLKNKRNSAMQSVRKPE
jgi:hypothetical protein